MAEKGTLLFKDKQVKILTALANKDQEWYLSSLAKAADATYVHTSKFITRCEQLGLVNVTKHGKIKTLTLTDKGAEVAGGIAKVIEKMAVKLEEVVQPPAPPEKK
ncbi:MAG: winged helix DNA-binding protein [Candidatus Micrarchaeota archaeon]|nr:winged helix DNA-binding protein [Candidatus Micrarchaeota archaeon]